MLTSILITIMVCTGGPKEEFNPNKCKLGVIECTVKDAKDINVEIQKCIKDNQ